MRVFCCKNLTNFYSKKRLNWGSSCLHSKSTVLVWCCSRKMNINAPNAATF
ncbi:Uncharacterised protein [Vibrio cholerae]|nr:Uncharacterised protein [Vibrio cholerae]